MSSLIPLDRVVSLIKNIIDGIRCPICDKSTGDRRRYACGHISCDDCFSLAEGCILCLTPPFTPELNKVADKPLSDRVNSANNLLHVCQETFKVDVYKRNRISEQLKVEKELFPECIQAPVKYCNKRKSFTSISNKENRFQLPGEQTSPLKQFTMKKHNSSVQNWLNKNVTYSRKVFSELNVNVNQHNYAKTSKNVNENILSGRKRNYSLSPVRQLEKLSKDNKRNKKSLIIEDNYWNNQPQKKCDHEESGIVLDDEQIYIEDSQSEIFDKDKLALQAVESAENELSDSLSLKSLEQTQDLKLLSDNKWQEKPAFLNTSNVKVPFYRKGSLLEKCAHKKILNVLNNTSPTIDSKNVSISIENRNFITTINISNCVVNQQGKSSISVQTDICDFIDSGETNNYTIKKKEDIINVLKNPGFANNMPYNAVEKKMRNGDDIDIFIDDCKMKFNNLNNKCNITPEAKELKKKHVVIDDSDSDTTSEESSFLQVSADVHVSCEPHDYGILSEIHSDQVICRSRNKVRGATPDSNNSSEKENFDPNKIKKRKGSKKIKSTKK